MADDKKDKAKDKAKDEKKGGAEKKGGEAKGGGAPAQAKGGGDKKGGKDKGGKKGETQSSAAAAGADDTKLAADYKPRLRLHYQKSVTAALTKKFSYKNPMQVPRLEKVVINMGLGAAVGNPKIIDSAVEDMRSLAGQKPVVT